MKSQTKLFTVLVVALVMIAAAAVAPNVMAGATGPGVPPMPSVAASTTYTFINARAITTSTAILYSTTNLDLGQWPLADAFVTADVSGTATITVTPQYSADNVNWADAYYTYVTQNQTGTATLNTGNYQVVLSADGTSFKRVPIVGQYFRFKVDNTGVVTVTIKATLKDGVR